jgi:3-hydroxyacyl-[acyl-carrier-protein] dehydratase
MPPPLYLDPATLDLETIVADKEAIRRHNPQRYDMEQLDAIVLIDEPNQLVVGYKDVREDEFWVRGHMPGYPLMPGVLMCEAAAQLCSYFVCTHGLQAGDFMGFGGMENVRFRSPVHPGDRLVLVGKGKRVKSRQMIFDVQGFVGTTMVFHAEVIGMALVRGE